MENVSIADEFTPLVPSEVSLHKDSFGDLQVKVNGEVYKKVEVSRAFPYSSKGEYIILESDGEEIGIIENINDLNPENKELLQEKLEKAYFIPIIKKVKDIQYDFRKPIWYVETDRGDMSFEVRTRRDANFISSNRVVIKDANGNKYEISDYNALDAESKELIEREVT